MHNLEKKWRDPSLEEPYFLRDMSDNEGPNLKIRMWLKLCLKNGWISKKPENDEPKMIYQDEKTQRNHSKNTKNNKVSQRNGQWNKLQVPLALGVFGIKVAMALIQKVRLHYNWKKYTGGNWTRVFQENS